MVDSRAYCVCVRTGIFRCGIDLGRRRLQSPMSGQHPLAFDLSACGAAVRLAQRHHRPITPSTHDFPPDQQLQQPVVVGFGNPLLDITVSVSGSRLAKLGVRPGMHASTMPDEQKKQVLAASLADPARSLSAGGSAFNSLRAAAWVRVGG